MQCDPNNAMRRATTFAIGVLALCAIAIPADADTITVTNTNDSGPGSLRQALADAQDSDTIQFDPALNGQTINLTSAQLVIQSNATIDGPGATLLTVKRDPQAADLRIFDVMPGHTVEINGLTISGGHITGDNAGDNGGGILNDNSTLTIAHCTIYGNAIVSASFANSGGGIYNSGTMTLNQVIVSNNNASFSGGGTGAPSGGGISNTGTMTIIAGTVQSNMGFWSAGGIYNTGMMTITSSTINDNQNGNAGHFGGPGGGIVNGGTMTIQDSTISGNRAVGGDIEGGDGGGIYNAGPLQIIHCSITANTGRNGGGVAGGGNIAHTTFSNNSASSNGGAIYVTSSLELGNTILKAGASGVNIFNNGGSFITHGYNISSDDGSGFSERPRRPDQYRSDVGPLAGQRWTNIHSRLVTGQPRHRRRRSEVYSTAFL
jgi:predicted outer membrane repeat protein